MSIRAVAGFIVAPNGRCERSAWEIVDLWPNRCWRILFLVGVLFSLSTIGFSKVCHGFCVSVWSDMLEVWLCWTKYLMFWKLNGWTISCRYYAINSTDFVRFPRRIQLNFWKGSCWIHWISVRNFVESLRRILSNLWELLHRTPGRESLGSVEFLKGFPSSSCGGNLLNP